MSALDLARALDKVDDRDVIREVSHRFALDSRSKLRDCDTILIQKGDKVGIVMCSDVDLGWEYYECKEFDGTAGSVLVKEYPSLFIDMIKAWHKSNRSCKRLELDTNGDILRPFAKSNFNFAAVYKFALTTNVWFDKYNLMTGTKHLDRKKKYKSVCISKVRRVAIGVPRLTISLSNCYENEDNCDEEENDNKPDRYEEDDDEQDEDEDEDYY